MANAPARTEISATREGLLTLIEEKRLQILFQPIFDLRQSRTVGFEALVRGEGDLFSPAALFSLAQKEGLVWELEQSCRNAAFKRFSELDNDHSGCRLFLNVSPHILNDPRFVSGSTLTLLDDYEIAQDRVVIEVTERDIIEDLDEFRLLTEHYVTQGFKVALDDFGAGESGLVTLIAAAPHFIKLDLGVVRNIHSSAYKQHLVRALTAFADSVDTALVAEGVETIEELEVLIRLGVRYVQGFLVAKPDLGAPTPSRAFQQTVASMVSRFTYSAGDPSEYVSYLTIRCETIEEGTQTGRDIDLRFRKEHNLDHLVVMRNREAIGLVTRESFHRQTSGPVGYHLFMHRPVELMMRASPLTVEGHMPITKLAKLAMGRPREERFDPVLVVDSRRELLGTVTIRQLVERASELEIETAQGSNPLTGLPGNRSIEKWMNRALESNDFTLVYVDLDRFKEFNDSYGFVRGDEMIRLASKVLCDGLKELDGRVSLGHVGGDDFVIVGFDEIPSHVLESICLKFDSAKRDLFDSEDIERGYYEAIDRSGKSVTVKPVTMSMAVLPGARFIEERLHPARMSSAAATLKKRVKKATLESGHSEFMIERRTYSNKLPKPESQPR